MKKLILFIVVVLCFGTTYGQTIQKGNVIGFHVITLNLNPDVTLNQFMDVMINKAIPEYNKNFPGVKHFVVKGLRGECVNCYAWILQIESEAVRNKYWKEDGGYSDAGNTALQKMQPVLDELYKMATPSTKYTDWMVQ